MSEFADTSIGATLRGRRLELGISLDEVAARTRIRKSYLEALEAEQFDTFPGETYLKGYLKGYAESLGLDPQVLLRSLAGVHAHAPRPVPLATATRSPSAPLALRGIALLVGAVILGLLGWLLLGRPPSAPAPEPQPSAQGSPVQEAPLPVASPVGASPGEPAAQEQQASDTPVAPAASEPGAVPAGSDATLPSVAATPVAEVSAAAQGAAPEDPVISPGAAGVLRLQASGPGQLELAIDGRPPQRYTLQANTILSWKVSGTARIYLENPANVRLWLDGREFDLAGRTQIVLQSAQEPRQ